MNTPKPTLFPSPGEQAPPAEPTLITHAVTGSGWSLRVTWRQGFGFDAVLTGPIDTQPYTAHGKETAEEAIGDACSYLRDFLGHPEAARALRLTAFSGIRR